MSEPPKTVGAPSELANAEEMPGCVVAMVKVWFAIPYFFFRELPTLPIDGFAVVYDRFGKWAAAFYVVVVLGLVGACCGGVISWII